MRSSAPEPHPTPTRGLVEVGGEPAGHAVRLARACGRRPSRRGSPSRPQRRSTSATRVSASSRRRGRAAMSWTSVPMSAAPIDGPSPPTEPQHPAQPAVAEAARPSRARPAPAASAARSGRSSLRARAGPTTGPGRRRALLVRRGGPEPRPQSRAPPRRPGRAVAAARATTAGQGQRSRRTVGERPDPRRVGDGGVDDVEVDGGLLVLDCAPPSPRRARAPGSRRRGTSRVSS